MTKRKSDTTPKKPKKVAKDVVYDPVSSLSEIAQDQAIFDLITRRRAILRRVVEALKLKRDATWLKAQDLLELFEALYDQDSGKLHAKKYHAANLAFEALQAKLVQGV